MDVLRFGDTVALGQNRIADDLLRETQRLASGLRISSAADDPSGLAVSQSLLAQANGLQQGQQNIQTALDLVQTADGGLQTVSNILMRMRDLVVEASTNLQSASQSADIQAEIDQLGAQINTISGNTQFNGQHLLDGSLSSDLPQFAQYYVPRNDTVSSGLPIVDPTSVVVNPQAIPIAVSFTVTADLGAGNDPGGLVPNDVLAVTLNAVSSDPNFGPPQTQTFYVVAGTNETDVQYALGLGVGSPDISVAGLNGNTIVGFNFNALTASDIGKTFTLYTVPAQQEAPGQALQVNLGQAEGDILTVDIPGVSTNNLGISELELGTVTASDMLNPNVNPGLLPQDAPGAAGDINLLTNQTDEYRIDHALQMIEGVRAQIGAQMVRLQEAAQDAQIQQTATMAAASNIRDANIGQDVTSYTRDQVLSQLQAQVLSALHVDALQVVSLVSQSFGVGGGGIGGGGGSGGGATARAA